ncbi:MAG: acyltransferase [Micrococcales bacterium]|nr:acyltransferase [Micrococcales bacterium]
MPLLEATTRHRARDARSLRGDIEGLRALAIGSVLAFHGASRFFPGGFVGVDIFFVISGFLITGVILKEVEATGKLSLARFWSRRAKRLLPAAAAVLGFCSIVAWVWLPRTQRSVFGWDVIASALYWVNWRLAGRSVDYLAEGIEVSPVQHFWSLAVEEQFYIVWPLLILAALVLARRFGWRRKPVLAVAITLVSASSLAASVVETGRAAPAAFFVTHTRMWELGLGALVALAAGRLARLPERVLRLLGVAGLPAMLASVWVVSESTVWPSWRPLLPCLGAACVIVSGLHPGGVIAAVLSIKPLVWIGGLSYSLYLWHWPILIAAKALWPDSAFRVPVLAVAVSVLPAWLVHRLVENPIRFAPKLSRSPGLALSIGANCSLLGVAFGLALTGPLSPPFGSIGGSELGAWAPPGAAVVEADGSNIDELSHITTATPILPDPAAAYDDLPRSYHDGCLGYDPRAPIPCVDGDRDATTRIVTVGDSMMQQWEPAFDIIGKNNHIRFELYTLSRCVLSPTVSYREGVPYPQCTEWAASVMDALLANPPDFVIVSHIATKATNDPDLPEEDADEQTLIDGLHTYWKRLDDAGIRVVVLAKNHGVARGVPECVDEHRTQLDECARQPWTTIAEAQLHAVETSPVPVDFINLNDAICGELCPAVIGNVLVYRQGDHMTATFVKTLAPRLEAALLQLMGEP